MDGRIAIRDLHNFRANIIGITANARSLSGQSELCAALNQCLRGQLAVCDVSVVAENADWLAGRLIINGAPYSRTPANLPVRADDAKFDVERLAAAHGR